MKLIFCSDPFFSRQPDSAYQDEVSATIRLGLEYYLISYEALVDEDNPNKAVCRVTEQSIPELGIYRGWMLKPEQYGQLFNALSHRGIYLINSPAAYTHCHYLPECYSIIEPYTPKSVWIKTSTNVSFDLIMKLIAPFGERPIIVKDFVKSQKHKWLEACYIPSASDKASVVQVVTRFLELQSNNLNEGLVFREFIEFEPLTNHSKSGMPLTKEFRIFFLDDEPIYSIEYWEEGDYQETFLPIEQFRPIAKAVKSRFFTIDVAKRVDGNWMIIELGDGQVAGLPEKVDLLAFYKTFEGTLSPPHRS